MYHPARFPPGSAHSSRRDLLRDISDLLRDMAPADGERFFKRWDQQGKRGMYVLTYAGEEHGLEKSQTELVAFGMLIALLATRAPVSPTRLTELLNRIRTRLPDGTYPRTWNHEPQPETPTPNPEPAAKKPARKKKT